MRIKELQKGDKKDAKSVFYGRYMAGFCVAWAIAAYRKFRDHDLVGIWSGMDLMHAATYVGKNYFDVRGMIGMAELVHGWGGCELRHCDEQALLDGDPKISEPDIDLAMFHIELLYPEYCGDARKLSARRQRLGQFIHKLEQLCDQHGVYLRSDLPRGQSIIMYEKYGDESGFELSFSATGGAYLDRILKE